MRKLHLPDLKPVWRALLYLATTVLAALSIVGAACEGVFPRWAVYLFYGTAAAALCFSCLYLVRDLRRLKRFLREMAGKGRITGRCIEDKKYRTGLAAVMGIPVNAAIALYNGVVAAVAGSPWFGTLCAYYLILGIMRAYWIAQHLEETGLAPGRRFRIKKTPERKIRRRYGILFITMAFVLGGAVILLIHLEGGKSYPGYTIYVAAAYAFTKSILAVWNTVSAGRKKEQSWIIIRSIELADAAVSILSLQTAMFSSFSSGDEAFRSLMNGITGAVVSLITLLIGVFYLAASRRKVES